MSGVDSTFEDMWQRYYPRLHVFVSGMIRGTGLEADDLVQEIMLKVHRKLESYNPRFALSTWIYTVARNHCIDARRRETRQPAVSSSAELSRVPAQRYPSPDAVVLEREVEEEVDRFMGALSETDRQIAYLKFFEELPYRSIGKIMDIPIGTAKYRVHEIRASLKVYLEGEHDLSQAIG